MLHEYSYVNLPVLDRLLQQSPNRRSSRESEASIEGSFAGVKAGFKRKSSSDPKEESSVQKLLRVIDLLRDSGQLKTYRPERAREFWRSEVGDWWTSEQLIATPVLLRLPSSGEEERTMRVWVGQPLDPYEEPEDEWDWIGSFLFLVEDLIDFPTSGPNWGMSGISALRMFVEFIVGREIRPSSDQMFEAAAEHDKYGRFEYADPIDKPRRAGGQVGRATKIETIYKIAYMTDEQCYKRGDEFVRVNDILAYPLYLAV